MAEPKIFYLCFIILSIIVYLIISKICETIYNIYKIKAIEAIGIAGYEDIDESINNSDENIQEFSNNNLEEFKEE